MGRTAIGSGSLSGQLYVNSNNGIVWQVDMTTGDCVQVAVGGTRGDFATPDPNNGSLMLTQSTTILRLTAPAGGRFGQTPPAPLGLRATPGNGQAALAWNPVAGATAYTLSRALSPSGPFQPVAANVPGVAWVDPGLTNGTTYYYVVSAANGFGTGPASNVASITPDGGLPLPVNAAAFVSQSVPSAMTAGQAYPVTVTMKNTGTSVWTGAGGYHLGSQAPQGNTTWGLSRVGLPGSSSGSPTPAPVQPGATATFNFNVTAPPAPGNYAFQWRMVQDGVEWFGDFTPIVNVTVSLPVIAPDSPVDLSAVSTGSGQITLYWTRVPGATGYNVYRGTTAGGEDYAHPVNGAPPVDTPSYPESDMDLFTDTGLADGTEYFYTVEIVRGSDTSPPSHEDSDIADPNAVPWTSTNPGDVLNAVRSAYAGGDVPVIGALSVAGPDGQIFEDGQSQVQPPEGQVTPGTNTYVLSDGDQITLNNDDDSVSGPIAGAGIAPFFVTNLPNSHSGPYRRVRTVTGSATPYDGATGYFSLPSGAGAHLGVVSPNTVSTDSLDLLLGSSSYNGTKEVDAGLMYFNSAVTGIAWRPYMKTSPTLKSHVVLPQGDEAFASGETVNVGYIAHPEGHPVGSKGLPCLVTIEATDGSQHARSLAAYIGYRYNEGVRVKRTISIAQPTRDPLVMQNGYRKTNSLLSGVSWYQGALLNLSGGISSWNNGNTSEDGSFPSQGGIVSWFETSPFTQEDNINISLLQP